MSQSQSQVQQSRNAAQFQLRLPDDLKTRIQDLAEMSGRSLNSEIVAALIEKFSPAQIAAKALLDLVRFINDGKDDEEFFNRLREAEYFLKEAHPSADISAARDGTITITVNL